MNPQTPDKGTRLDSRDAGREPVFKRAVVERNRSDLDAGARRELAALAARRCGAVIPLELRAGRLVSPIHPFVARRHELPHARLRAHGCALLELLEGFLEEGWTLTDGDPQNFTWASTGPVLLDWGSPVPREPNNAPWNGLRQFAETVLYPLLLSARTGIPPSRWLRAFTDGVGAEEVRNVLGGRAWRGPLWVWILMRGGRGAVLSTAGKPPRKPQRQGDALPWLLRRLRKALDRLPAPERRWRHRGWASHREAHSYPGEALAERQGVIAGIAERRRPRRVLDLGAHRGALLTTALAKSEPEHCVAVDMDPGCTEALHKACRKQPVTLVEADLVEAQDLPARLGLFKPELTIACGLIHHLALARSDGLERAADIVAACAGTAPGTVLVLEWVPRDDPQLRSLYDNDVYRSPQLDGYSLDALRAALSGAWSLELIRLPGTGRKLLRCERRL